MFNAQFVHRCLALAARGRGKVGCGALVGAVLVRDGKILAEGAYEEFGGPHSERQLLEKFDQKIRSTDVLYVNLEPCCHTNKKTPPCAQFLIERGVKQLVYGMIDPNPQVAGKGIALLQSAGVHVEGPVLPADCARLNRGFVSVQNLGRPWITLKQARTVDGRIANPDGSSLRITTEAQDRWSHQYLRARHDAILTGIGTILADDPQLTVRFVDAPPDVYRIIMDPHFKIPLEAKVVNGELAERTIVVRKETDKQKQKILEERGVRVIQIPYRDESFDWQSLWKSLITPKGEYHGLTSILVEGGAKTWETFRKTDMVDEEVVLVGS